MTLSGTEKLKKELEYLKNIRRPEIIKSIKIAREHGDLKENAEYHAAKEQQSFCEGKIQDIIFKLSNSQIIDITKIAPSNKVIFGSTVKIENLKTKNKYTYRIVGNDESNYKENLISINSPISRGLIGNKAGDVITICAPKGNIKYKILKVEYL